MQSLSTVIYFTCAYLVHTIEYAWSARIGVKPVLLLQKLTSKLHDWYVKFIFRRWFHTNPMIDRGRQGQVCWVGLTCLIQYSGILLQIFQRMCARLSNLCVLSSTVGPTGTIVFRHCTRFGIKGFTSMITDSVLYSELQNIQILINSAQKVDIWVNTYLVKFLMLPVI